MSDVRIKIYTTDNAWIAANAVSPSEHGTAVIDVPDAAITRLTFAGAKMVRFDMHTVAPKMPRDWGNRYAMVPARHVVSR
jgi:hypothetical protein